MDRRQGAATRFWRLCVVTAAVSMVWAGTLVADAAAPAVAQHLSNVGLAAAALAAGVASMRRATVARARVQRFWLLLGASALSWGAGQVAWTWYESWLGQEVPFPSLADVGYLGAVPLAGWALLSLPVAESTFAGRVRSVFDGLMVAVSLFVCSWIVVLGPLLRSGGDLVPMMISLAYPAGDVVLMTLVMYTALRARHVARRLPISLPMVGGGLIAIAVADSGFMYLTTVGAYSSGNIIDLGWFLGFVLIFLASQRPSPDSDDEEQGGILQRPLGSALPYTAVLFALFTSAAEVALTGSADVFVSWSRTVLIVLLVCRQVLTLMENHALTRTLEARVIARTAELRAREQRFAALVQHSSDVVTIIDENCTVLYQSPASERVLGYTAESLLGRRVTDLMDEEATVSFIETLRHVEPEPYRVHTSHARWRLADGNLCHVEVTVTNLLDNPDVGGLVLNTRNITDRKALEDQLVHQAFHDSLTSLANRALFKDRTEHALQRAQRESRGVGVLFLDLDGFKQVNDSFGHACGDLLLVQVSERLRRLVRPGDTVARLGGDEFAVLVDGVTDDAVLTDMAHRIGTTIEEPFVLDGQEVHLQGSIGIAAASRDIENAEQLLRNADLAMYRAKAVGDGGFAQYDPQLHAQLVDRVRLESDLRRALDNGELELHYQPLIDMRSGDITGLEALLRWPHPERGMVAPGDFIPLAESTGLIRPIGAWVLAEACRQTVVWQQASPSLQGLKVNVNVSARQLRPELSAQLAEILAQTQLDPSCLVLEMTESVLVAGSLEMLDLLHELKALGVRLAIDDFGTGYSSLSYLHQFPVDIIKIDRSFVDRLSSGGDAELVSTIVRLGQTMRLETVAEGIENHQQFLALRRLGCTAGQGFHFSKPVPADQVPRLLEDQYAVGAGTVA